MKSISQILRERKERKIKKVILNALLKWESQAYAADAETTKAAFMGLCQYVKEEADKLICFESTRDAINYRFKKLLPLMGGKYKSLFPFNGGERYYFDEAAARRAHKNVLRQEFVKLTIEKLKKELQVS